MNTKARAVNLRKETYDVYCGRPGKGKEGFYGNPVAVGKPCPVCANVHTKGGKTLPCYKRDLVLRILKEEGFVARAIKELPGKRLGCFCKPKPCHCDVLADWINKVVEFGLNEGTRRWLAT